MSIIKKHDLDFEKVFPYFFEHIGCGKTLSSKVVKRINFREGTFFTILPDTIDESKLFWFDCGLIPPSEPNIITTTDGECSELIKKFLDKSSLHCAIVGDYMQEPTKSSANIDNVKMVPYENEIYYLLNAKNSEREIWKGIRSGLVWHTLIILTSLKNAGEIILLDDLTLNAICDNAQYVLAGAYDGDSYIFWQKDKNDLSTQHPFSNSYGTS